MTNLASLAACSSGKARTFDYQAGDVGYVPFAMGHYVLNTGDETLVFLEMFKSDHFTDISLGQWMALVPPGLVRDHLHADRALMDELYDLSQDPTEEKNLATSQPEVAAKLREQLTRWIEVDLAQ